MHRTTFISRLLGLALLLLLLLLQACTTPASAPLQEFDFAPIAKTNIAAVNTTSTTTPKLTINLADLNAPSNLDSEAMFYRLAYNNLQLLHPYAQHQWSMSPAKLLTQRLKSHIAAAGFNVAMPGEGVSATFTLRIDLDEFDQVFDSPTQSHAQISLRASVVKGRNLVAQRSFTQQIKATSADAAGGAKALQDASDAVIATLLQWLQEIPSS